MMPLMAPASVYAPVSMLLLPWPLPSQLLKRAASNHVTPTTGMFAYVLLTLYW